MSGHRPRLLIIAGSDSGGGAGIQADLRTCAAHGVFGTTAVTAITAQNTRTVARVAAVDPTLVAAQIDTVLEDIGTDAVKIGMLGDAAIVSAVAEVLSRHDTGPVVLDPVMVAKSGDALLADDAVAAVRELLVPRARVVTPNLPELARLLDAPEPVSEDERVQLAQDLATSGPAVLAKGGHAAGPRLTDLLVDAEGVRLRLTHPRRATSAVHGTGCTLASALACRLASGQPLDEATEGAVRYLQGALAAARPLGRGHGPVDHLWELLP